MEIGNKNSNRSKDLKLVQSLHCNRVRPWLKSTSPRTSEGNLKVAENLPKASKIIRSFGRLNELLSKLDRQEPRYQKRQLSSIQRFNKLAKKR